MEDSNNTQKRAHIYEVDLLRALTVFSVVSIHVISSTASLASKPHELWSLIIFIIHALHFNREMFMFVTGLVLTYSYYNRPFSSIRFWMKRFLFIFIPYVLWTLIYIKYNHSTLNSERFFRLFIIDLYTGRASYQLYYILLTLQFYAVFPFFLWFIKKVANHPFLTLAVSFTIQIVGIYFDYKYIQGGIFLPPLVKNFILPYQGRIFLAYQFFFVLGAFGAIYMNNVVHFLKKYGRLLPLLILATLSLFAIYLNYQIYGEHKKLLYALSVLQPSVVLYSTIVILFFAWVAILWAKGKRMYTIIRNISHVSFGIFFVHVLVLTFIIKKILPHVSPTIPGLAKIILIDLATFIISLLVCLLIVRLPLLSWTIGRRRHTK